MKNLGKNLHPSAFFLPILLLLTGCNLVSQLKQTTQVIEDNRQTIERSSWTIAENADTIARSSETISANENVIRQTNDAIRENFTVVQESTAAIHDNLITVSKSNEAIKKNVELLESLTAPVNNLDLSTLGLVGEVVALLLFIPWIALFAYTWRVDRRLKQIHSTLKEKTK